MGDRCCILCVCVVEMVCGVHYDCGFRSQKSVESLVGKVKSPPLRETTMLIEKERVETGTVSTHHTNKTIMNTHTHTYIGTHTHTYIGTHTHTHLHRHTHTHTLT